MRGRAGYITTLYINDNEKKWTKIYCQTLCRLEMKAMEVGEEASKERLTIEQLVFWKLGESGKRWLGVLLIHVLRECRNGDRERGKKLCCCQVMPRN
jgi:hypothetical protein